MQARQLGVFRGKPGKYEKRGEEAFEWWDSKTKKVIRGNRPGQARPAAVARVLVGKPYWATFGKNK